MAVAFGKGCRDIARQSLGNRDSVVVRSFEKVKESYFGKRVTKLRGKLRFMNEYLPEDKEPVHAWSVILVVAVLTFSGPSQNVAPEF